MPGPKSDISLFREYSERFHPNQKFKADLAYIGEDLITTPIKKPKNKELTIEQKELNQQFSSKRVYIEHRIRSLKIFRVIQERFRLNSKKYSKVMLTVCGLIRFRMGMLILPQEKCLKLSG